MFFPARLSEQFCLQICKKVSYSANSPFRVFRKGLLSASRRLRAAALHHPSPSYRFIFLPTSASRTIKPAKMHECRPEHPRHLIHSPFHNVRSRIQPPRSQHLLLHPCSVPSRGYRGRPSARWQAHPYPLQAVEDSRRRVPKPHLGTFGL